VRAVKFLLYELVLRGALFAALGTAALSALYLASIGAPPGSYAETARSFVLMMTGSPDFSALHPGFSAGRIIASGAAVTLPLALASIIVLALVAFVGAALSTTADHLASEYGSKAQSRLLVPARLAAGALAAIPLFVSYWILGKDFGGEAPFPLIAAATALTGGLGWDAARFLVSDMRRQAESTHTMVFGTLGMPLGRLLPLPGTLSGYLLSSSVPRFLPYLAGKVPAIIGGVTIAEIIFSFPGLGSSLMDALLERNVDLLVSSVFMLLCLNAIVAFIVRAVLFLVYPRWYEKAV
jgi:ABC-type dipeptide/oligopeptide/nickel transport system permease component